MNTEPSKDKLAISRLTGAVYTPPDVARSLALMMCDFVPARAIRILEPSVGDGVLINAIQSCLSQNNHITAVDINCDVINNLSELVGENDSFDFVADDFLRYAVEYRESNAEAFDLVIGNPPFIRKRNYSEDFKLTLSEFSESFGYSLQNLKNAWVAFLLASSRMVAEDGIVGLLLPYELLTVNYGQHALEKIISEFERVDIFVSDDKAFPGIDQDAVVFFGQKKTSKESGLFINRVASFTSLDARTVNKIEYGDKLTRSLELNSFLLPERSFDALKSIYIDCKKVSDYADTAPGIVSGANDFFILSEKHVNRLGLDDKTLPILKKGSFAGDVPVFSQSDFIKLAETEATHLLKLAGDRDALDIDSLEYIKEGELEDRHLGYKCRNRKNWYEVPIVPREEGFFFKRSHSFPKVIVNDADVYVTDTAYGIRLKDDATMKGFCFSFYNSLTMLFSEINGRFYGGGVLELTPNEFRGLPMVYKEPTKDQFNEFLNVHRKAKGDIIQILDFGDVWLKEELHLSEKRVLCIREAWSAVRTHRMRHSGSF